MKPFVIAIDGPAASGKSTTARLVAERLGYIYLDTGAMYRAMTLKALREELDVGRREEIESLAGRTTIRVEPGPGGLRILVDGEDVTQEIRSPDVDRAVSAVSSYARVRDMMVREQRRMGEQGGIVLEGRDIGTVVFPEADLKIYMVADVNERARRRQEELRVKGIEADFGKIVEDIIRRDEKDSSRNVSPLRRADDAVVVDTSEMTIDQQVDFIVGKAEERLRRQ